MTEFLICILLQFVLFIPFFLIWQNDCKEIGKENLITPLVARFIIWLILCPFWLLGILI